MKRNLLAALLCLSIATAHADGWEYETSTDQMTSRRTVTARLFTPRALSLDFPYKGDNWSALFVRQHPQHGLDVALSIEKGQFTCSSIECSVTVRFGDKPPMRFGGNRPSDHSSTTIFLDNPKRFIAEAKQAKTILVQSTIFRNGAPVLTFYSSDPLTWPPK